MPCKICGEATSSVLQGRLLGKYDVEYHSCGGCGLVQTDAPFWLEEAYSRAIASVDLGPISRAMLNARIVETLLLTSFDPKSRYIDWGAGYGVFVRIMRDLGYDFYWSDEHCENLFAQHFVADPTARYELLTTFEVFEHLSDPVAGLESMLAKADNVFFSTVLVPPGGIKDWWYLTPETGQHITFHTRESLKRLGERFGLRLLSNGRDYHLFTRKPVRWRPFEAAVRDGRLARLLRAGLRRRWNKQSLLSSDWAAVSGWNV